jgi:hypothetical protein
MPGGPGAENTPLPARSRPSTAPTLLVRVTKLYGAFGEPRQRAQQLRCPLLRSVSNRQGFPRCRHQGWDADPSYAASFLSGLGPRPRSHSRRAQLVLAEHPSIGSSQLPSLWGRSPCRSDLRQERLCEPLQSFLEGRKSVRRGLKSAQGRGCLPRPGLPRNVRTARRSGSDVRLGHAGLEPCCIS